MCDDNSDSSLSFTSPEFSLEEARRRYDNEETRRDSLENKISILITVDALIISIVSSIGNQPNMNRAIVLSPALLSSIIGLLLIYPQLYANPVQNRFYNYAKWEESEAYDVLFASYIDAIERNVAINRFKFVHFQFCIFFTISSIILIIFINGIDIYVLSEYIVFISPQMWNIYLILYRYYSSFAHITLPNA